MSELPKVLLPASAAVGDEVVVSSEANGDRWTIVSTNKALTRRRFRCMSKGAVVVPPPPPVEPPPVVTPPPAPTPTVMGPGIVADTLANAQVGGSDAATVAFRFRADHSGPLASVKVYWMGPTHENYGAGTGGTIRITLHDDASGIPATPVLAFGQVVHPADLFTPFGLVGGPLVAGRFYHLVFENVDPSPKANFVSVNACYTFGRSPQGLADWTQLARYGSSSWATRSGFVPILMLTYGDGHVQSQGYMEFSVRSGEYGEISGSKMVRQTVPSVGPVSRVYIRVRRGKGNDPLSITVEGSTFGTIDIPAVSIPVSAAGGDNAGSVTVMGTLTAPVSGVKAVRLWTGPGSLYTITPMRKGVSYGFPDPFPGGVAQRTSGTGWTSLGRVANQNDLPLWMEP